MGILDWRPRWTLTGTREPPAFYKDEGRQSLHITGSLIEEGQKMELMAVEEHEAFLDRLREILHEFDHDGRGDIIEMAEVAMTTFGFQRHSVENNKGRAEELVKAIGKHKSMIEMRKEGRRISSGVADSELWDRLK